MTDTITPGYGTRLIPPGKDVLDGLTVRELDLASRKLQVDVVDAFKGGAGGKRYAAFATVAWLWAKRTDPTVKIDPFMDLETSELLKLLGLDDDDDDDDQGDDDAEANPTDSGRG